jgi:VWFA-related protein
MLTHAHVRSALLALSALTCAFGGTATAGVAAEVRREDKNDASGVTTYRSIVSEVRVTFFATDENNRALDTVTKSDFAVVDSELVIRNFRSLTRSDETALDVVVLVDLSESVAPRVRTAIGDVLQLVAREQSMADDNISVLSFGGGFGPTTGIRPVILCSSGCRASDSVSKLQAVKSGGSTPLFDALIFAADFIAQHRRAGVRPVLILFSDGYDTISLHSASAALQAAQDEDMLIYSVDMGTRENEASRQSSNYRSNYRSNQNVGSIFLRQVAEATGGRYFSSSSGSSLRFAQPVGAGTVLNAVLDDLRASYVVSYDLPSHQAGFHSLRLLPTHNLNLTFHSRDGYNYEPSGP